MGQSSPPALPRVLIVEDDPILMIALVEFVENSGCEPVEASTIVEAIQILETRTDIRTVFTDLDMRGSTAGMELALLIRDRWPPIELLMISSRPWDEAQIPSRGVVLGKPFDRRKIEATLRRFAA
ncbi:response regulator [Methylobacterium platani]|uniref:Histidine kinase n=2 Tax=Methylobacterium platani TaxID=427683 RepID=A0A179SF44_9HYPH|nr:response regulator [Methylobacterium platani]KMO21356.1 histidine kinase [Methylobacterium platani JCM 14648]OAS25110.1 histidine kinase [Methylobacterium platani]